MFSEKYVERKLYRPTHLALLPMNARNSLETELRDREREMDEVKTQTVSDETTDS